LLEFRQGKCKGGIKKEGSRSGHSSRVGGLGGYLGPLDKKKDSLGKSRGEGKKGMRSAGGGVYSNDSIVCQYTMTKSDYFKKEDKAKGKAGFHITSPYRLSQNGRFEESGGANDPNRLHQDLLLRL